MQDIPFTGITTDSVAEAAFGVTGARNGLIEK